ncbi:MAG: HAMP domain-containing histidine kinase [Actinobacteria bacterium]|jgi:signal transduction histidine kinase|nr:HAMP domain-containing histidine kinase [Actinomycetota bacterium]
MRQRLVVSAVALVLTALLAFALPLAWAVRGLLEGRALDALQGAVEPIGLQLDRSRTCAELQLGLVQLANLRITLSAITTDGRVLATTAAGGIPVVGDEFELARSAPPGRFVDGDRVAVALPLSTGVCGNALLHATTGADALQRQTRGAWLVIAGIAATVALIAAAGAWVLGRRLAQPFERLATSAGQLGDGDFSARAPRSGLAEADRIADALDDTAERLGRSVARSNAFAADASHQLRTPLTALRLHLEALLATAPGPSVEAALDEADRLETTVDDLVALTRLDAAPRVLDLDEFVRERLPGWADAAARQQRAVAFEALPVPAVRARAGAVAQALQVLLDNALQHGTGTVTVRLAPALPDEPDGAVRLCVLDEGPADPPPSPAAPDGDGSRGAQVRHDRHGRGLPLARALIGAEGGEVSLVVDPDGSIACLVLPGNRPRT